MRKAIQLRATLWLEGNDEPAHDFSKAAMAAVRDIVAAGASRHPELRLTIKHLEESNDDDGDADQADTK